MSHVLSFAEIDGQHVELLPARTVLSLFSVGDAGAPAGGAPAGGAPAGGAPAGGDGGPGGYGGDGNGKVAFLHNWFYTEGDVYITNTAGTGGAAPGGAVGAAPGGAGAAAPAG